MSFSTEIPQSTLEDYIFQQSIDKVDIIYLKRTYQEIKINSSDEFRQLFEKALENVIKVTNNPILRSFFND